MGKDNGNNNDTNTRRRNNNNGNTTASTRGGSRGRGKGGGMICDLCRSGGELNKTGQFKRAVTMHKKCKEDCGCQHQTGPGVGSLAFAMAEPMRTQYPLE